SLRLEGAVVDGLGLLDLAVGPGADLLRARDRDLDLVEGQGLPGLAQDLHQLVHAVLSVRPAARPPRVAEKSGCLRRRPLGAAAAARVVSRDTQAARFSRSTFRPSDFSSFTSTLKLSGMPASKVSWSRTIASYTLVRPETSSDFTVSISCSV